MKTFRVVLKPRRRRSASLNEALTNLLRVRHCMLACSSDAQGERFIDHLALDLARELTGVALRQCGEPGVRLLRTLIEFEEGWWLRHARTLDGVPVTRLNGHAVAASLPTVLPV